MAVYRFRKEELEGHLNRNALWAIVYGDLMSYLMIMFLFMFSYQLSEALKFKKQPKVRKSLEEIQRVFGGKVDPRIAERAQRVDQELVAARRLEEAAAAGALGKDVKVIATEKRIQVNLGEGILFDSGKAELKPEADPVLKTIATGMTDLENEIRVEGHTDNVPIRRGPFKSNWELSYARAHSVVLKLVEAGVDPKRLSGSGYGEHRPAVPNDTPEGKAKNRRIEISLLREE